MSSNDILKKCSDAWVAAGRDLEIRVMAPYEIVDFPIHWVFAAYLPDFGSSSGCYLYPVVSLEHSNEWKSIHMWAQTHKQYLSFIRVDKYRTYNREGFIEALSDWGYFGPASLRPSWADQR